MKDKVVELISQTFTKDSIGQEKATPKFTAVFAGEKGIAQNEFFSAGQKGIKAAKKFIVYSFEYTGETELRYDGAIYNIYRTFPDGDDIELYCEVRSGGKTL